MNEIILPQYYENSFKMVGIYDGKFMPVEIYPTELDKKSIPTAKDLSDLIFKKSYERFIKLYDEGNMKPNEKIMLINLRPLKYYTDLFRCFYRGGKNFIPGGITKINDKIIYISNYERTKLKIDSKVTTVIIEESSNISFFPEGHFSDLPGHIENIICNCNISYLTSNNLPASLKNLIIPNNCDISTIKKPFGTNIVFINLT